MEFTAVSRPPETNAVFRRGQLLVLLSTFDAPLNIDRIGYFEFFAANPHLVVQGSDAVRLELAGFSPAALSYQSAPERYANRRARLRSDLAALTAWGYARPSTVDGRIVCELTDRGRGEAQSFESLYADAYRQSIDMIRPLFRLSDARLAARASEWLSGGGMRLDILDVDSEFQPTLNLDTGG